MDLLLHLRGFVAVADQLSVSYAADELGIDQPLLSRRLRALEKHLGVQLIDRSRRQIALTDAGVRLLPRARGLLDQADHLVAGVRNRPAELQLGLPGSADSAALAQLVSVLERQDLIVRVVPDDHDHDGPGWRVERTTVEAADWQVELGVITARRLPSDRVWLGELRPRRGRPGRELLITDDDDHPAFLDAVAAVADRSGLTPRLIRRAPTAHARAEVLAERATMIGDRRAADRDGLCWTPLADPELRRWYRLIERLPLPKALRAGPLRDRALSLLADVLGAAGASDAAQDAGRPSGSGPIADHADRWDLP